MMVTPLRPLLLLLARFGPHFHRVCRPFSRDRNRRKRKAGLRHHGGAGDTFIGRARKAQSGEHFGFVTEDCLPMRLNSSATATRSLATVHERSDDNAYSVKKPLRVCEPSA
jgi:hypothetical protein